MVDRQSMMSIREEGASGLNRDEPDLGKTVLRFIMHSALATVGGLMVGFVFLSSLRLQISDGQEPISTLELWPLD